MSAADLMLEHAAVGPLRRGGSVATFTARLCNAVDLEPVRTELLEVVNRAVEPALGSVWIRQRKPG